jgi:putative ABC transport system substrate-binding protein
VRRRDFITLIGGTATGWPLAARAQNPQRMRRIAAMMPEPENLAESQARRQAFEQAMSQLGWLPGRSIAIDYRWAVGNAESARTAIKELLELSPDVVLAVATPAAKTAQATTKTLPVVFIGVSEPVTQGIVPSLAHPGGNITGFTNLEPSFGAKLMELLKEMAPSIDHVAILFNPGTAPFAPSFARAAEAAAMGFAIGAEIIALQKPADIEAAVAKVASEPQGGLIFPPDTFTSPYVKQITELSAHYRLPAVYSLKYFPPEGGLASYGIDVVDQFRRAASYVDRILKGENPADLPVQQPVKFELILNLKTAKALGLTLSPTLLATADEVIE